ncbi:ABC transporter substrate-binding protein [Halococcus saccharolyticus]|uniref:Fe/B12 periplasmic-binding domain-containing protein n=1 Tax=Halococcus saccharolyticus DSM 5350 TaxID=1227455 RepID=M0MG64_9EURY|nr:ABC transporter substrate-binding protein [Halococcus saccharolyticus]EMA43410.1 hypothetical protein C449_15587 [Halococcus saccharolyticus DSM 5350]
MEDESAVREGQTRRDCVKYGGAVIAGGLLAGCTGGSGSGTGANGSTGSDSSNTTTSGGETAGSSDSESENATSGGGESSYSVTMAPMGDVAFESVPERWACYKEGYGEMGIALGMGDGLAGIDRPSEGLAVLKELYYDELPGFSLDTDSMANIRANGESIDKEIFYEVDADLHLMDPNLPAIYFDWKEGDVEEIGENVAPFFGNFIRRKRDESWGEPYEFYTLYEAFEKVAKVFKREERYEAFAALHEEFRKKVRSRLPPERERPKIGLLNGGSDPSKGKFYAIDPTAKGYEMKHYRDVGVRNAFAGVDTGENGMIDYETLLEVDPKQIFIHWGVLNSDEEFRNQYFEPMKQDSVGQQLTAVQNDRVFKGGTGEQGPITNLFQTELLAQQQYSEAFPTDEKLFDRQRVADIVKGNQ